MILSYLNPETISSVNWSLFEGRERSTRVRAKTTCEVAEISYQSSVQLIQVNPDILMRLFFPDSAPSAGHVRNG